MAFGVYNAVRRDGTVPQFVLAQENALVPIVEPVLAAVYLTLDRLKTARWVFLFK